MFLRSTWGFSRNFLNWGAKTERPQARSEIISTRTLFVKCAIIAVIARKAVKTNCG